MDSGRINHQAIQQKEVAVMSKEMAATPPPPSSEAGRIAADVGATIEKWQHNVRSGLEEWLNDAEQIQQIIDDIKGALNNFQKVKAEYIAILNDPQRKQSGTSALKNRKYDFNTRQLDYGLKLLSFLGIPPSAIRVSSTVPSGYAVAITATQYISMFNLIQQTITAKLSTGTLVPQSTKDKISGEISDLKHDQTKAMFKVMGSFNAVKMNENTLSSILEFLKSMDNTIFNAIQ